MPVSVAVVGSGPAAFYTTAALIDSGEDVLIDIIERLPTPYGLIRDGVAPDHQTTKSITKKFEKITLNFGIKEINFKALVLVMSTLEAIASQKPIPTKSTKSNIFLKIRKGAPVGCKLTLRKSNMFTFFSKLFLLILLLWLGPLVKSGV